MGRFTALFSLLYLSIISSVVATQCITFDAGFNLLIFGAGGKDYNAGTQDKWSDSSAPSDITKSGRPPFDGPTTCYLSRFQNAIYVIGADSKNAAAVYIFDVSANTWSMQATTPGSFDLRSFTGVLDHDTNVFYALSNGELFFVDFTDQKAAKSTALTWTDAKKPSFDTTNYNPVMALAQNHIHFLNLPGVPAGSADIFVIHFSFFQPASQAFPTVDGGNSFPAAHGQTASFYQKEGAQQEFAFIPDDGSATYVINAVTNTTQVLPGPAIKDASATYFASITSLVQLDSKGVISYLPYTQGDAATNKAATWTKINSLSNLAPAPSSGLSTTRSATAGASTSTAKGSSSQGQSGSSQSSAVGGYMVPLASAVLFFVAVGVAL